MYTNKFLSKQKSLLWPCLLKLCTQSLNVKLSANSVKSSYTRFSSKSSLLNIILVNWTWEAFFSFKIALYWDAKLSVEMNFQNICLYMVNYEAESTHNRNKFECNHLIKLNGKQFGPLVLWLLSNWMVFSNTISEWLYVTSEWLNWPTVRDLMNEFWPEKALLDLKL